MDGAIVAMLGLLFYFVTLALLARCSHWAHKTQERLEKTNELLAELLRIELDRQQRDG